MANDHWQTKCLTISERTRFIFNNELLSDVKFIVPASNSESASRKMIPAHKFVLAIGSPVFYAMFFGEMAETKNSVELPDCEYESLSISALGPLIGAFISFFLEHYTPCLE